MGQTLKVEAPALEARRLHLVLAGNPAAPVDVVRRLARHPEYARSVARRRTCLPNDLVEAFLQSDDDRLAGALGHNDFTATSTRWRLAARAEPDVRASAVNSFLWGTLPGRPGIPPELLEQLSDDPDFQVRMTVAAHQCTSDGTRRKLAQDQDHHVRAVVAQSWSNGPPDVRVALLKDPHPEVRRKVTFRQQPPPADMKDELLADPATRANVLPFLDLTAQLAHDEDEMVRTALAKHPQLRSAVRDRLCDDPDLIVRSAVLIREDLYEPSRAALYEATTEIFGLGSDKFLHAFRDGGPVTWLDTASPSRRLITARSPLAFMRRSAAAVDQPAEVMNKLLCRLSFGETVDSE